MLEAPKRAVKFAANDFWGKTYRNAFGTDQMSQGLSVLTGETLFTFSTIPTPAPLIRDGQLRLLALSTARRTPAFPEAAPVAEQGFPGFAIGDWHGLLAPARTPRGMIAQMADAAVAALRQEEVRQRLTLLGAEPAGQGPEAFGAFLAAERKRLGAFIQEEGIRAD